MQCYGALRRPLRNIIKSIGYAHHTPEKAICADGCTDKLVPGQHARHDRSIHTNGRPVAIQRARTLSGRRRWTQDDRSLADGRSRGTAKYSTASAVSETHEDSTTAQEGVPGTESNHDQGLQITRRNSISKDQEGSLRYSTLAVEDDIALDFSSERSLADRHPNDHDATLNGHEPVRRVLASPVKVQNEVQQAPDVGGQVNIQQAPDQTAGSSYFDDMVEAVSESRPRDGPDYTKYAPYFGPRYFENQRKEQTVRNEKQQRRLQLQSERHPYLANDYWQKILKLLDTHTPEGESLYKKKVDTLTLPEGFLAIFHHDVSLAILEIRQRTGSHLQLVEGGTQSVGIDGMATTAYSILNLSGSMHENEAALRILPEYLYVYSAKELNASEDLNDYDLQRRQEDMPRIDDHQASNDGRRSEGDAELSASDLNFLNDTVNSLTSPVRSVWAMDRWNKDKSRHRLGTPPTTRTRVSMALYINEITMFKPKMAARRERKETTGMTDSHVEKVIQELVSLCTDPTAASWLTSEALDRALQYLLKHNNLRAFREIRRALSSSAKFGLTSSNYAVLLGGAARFGDLANFAVLLKLMLKREVPITAQIWIQFQKLISVRKIPGALSTLEEVMRRKGLLANNNVAQALSTDMVIERLNLDLDLGTPFEVFWETCNLRVARTYPPGFDWFDVPVASRMVQLLLQWGQLDHAYTVVDRLRERRKPVPTSILNVFLSSALRNGNPAAACSILQRFKIGQPGTIVPDGITYATLFTIAWTQKYFNMARVIWRYACAAGHVNYSMRSRLGRSLFRTAEDIERKVSRGRLWRLWAGKFAVGVSRGMKVRKRMTERPLDSMEESESRLVALVSQSDLYQGSEAAKVRSAALLDFMSNDLLQVGDCKPRLPLSRVLSEAYAKDMAWKEAELEKEWRKEGENIRTFVDMLKQGIRLPMKAGDATQDARPAEVPGAFVLLE